MSNYYDGQRPGFYAFVQLMKNHGMDVQLAKNLHSAGIVMD